MIGGSVWAEVVGMHIRVCRECGEEYRPEIVRCADCGGDLEDRYTDETSDDTRSRRPEPPAPEPPPDPVDEETVLSGEQAIDLAPLADALLKAGIEVRLRPRGSSPGEGVRGYELRVRREDRERALQELAPLIDRSVDPSLLEKVHRFDPDSGYRECPACSTTLPSGAVLCPECGLTLAETPDTRPCPQCRTPVGPDGGACPFCGHRG